METKLVRIAEISATSKHPIFTSVYHLINEDMLKQCHKELDGNKAVGIDKVTKDEYGKNLDRNIKELVQRLKNKSFKPLPSLSTDNVSSVRPLLCNPLPSIGIARFLQYYGIVRPPTIHLKYSVFSCNFILFFEKWQVLPS